MPDDISAKSDAPRSSGTQIKTVPLPQLLKQMTSHGLTMQEAIPIVGQLVKGGFAVPEKLSLLSHAALQELGIESVEMQKKVIGAFAGKRTAMMLKAANAGSDSEVSQYNCQLTFVHSADESVFHLGSAQRSAAEEPTTMRLFRENGVMLQFRRPPPNLAVLLTTASTKRSTKASCEVATSLSIEHPS